MNAIVDFIFYSATSCYLMLNAEQTFCAYKCTCDNYAWYLVQLWSFDISKCWDVEIFSIISLSNSLQDNRHALVVDRLPVSLQAHWLIWPLLVRKLGMRMWLISTNRIVLMLYIPFICTGAQFSVLCRYPIHFTEYLCTVITSIYCHHCSWSSYFCHRHHHHQQHWTSNSVILVRFLTSVDGHSLIWIVIPVVKSDKSVRFSGPADRQ